MSTLYEMTARELSAQIADKQITAREVTESVLERIDQVEIGVNAYLSRTSDRALEQADAVDARIAKGEKLGPLAGIPIAIKDNMCTCGVRTTSGSKILHNFVPPYNATVVDRIEAAGTVCVGKANLDEFAMGSSTENSGFGPSRNPWNTDCVPGGSSGGSAAAVAAGEAIVALGSDTGGSIRQPASFCGLVGLKPTYGRVSRYGLIAYASSLDQIGPLTKTVEDTALVLNAIAGDDPLDSTCVNLLVPDYTGALRSDVKGLKIGVPKEFFGVGVDPAVSKLIREAVEKLCDMGAEAEECSLPSIEYCLAAYYIIAPAEASSNLARFDGVKYGHRSKDYAGHIGLMEKTRDEGFGAEVKQRIMIGTYALSAGYYDAYYKRAQQVRTLIRRDFDAAFAKFDILATPTAPTVAFKVGDKADDPLAMKLADICTLPVNMAGIPGLSLPCGFDGGMPVGLQLLGKAFDEEMLLRVAYTYEQAMDWHTRRANL